MSAELHDWIDGVVAGHRQGGRVSEVRLKVEGGSVPMPAPPREQEAERPRDFHQAAPVPASEAVPVAMVTNPDGTPYSILSRDPLKHYAQPIAVGYVHTGLVHEAFCKCLAMLVRADGNVVAMHSESSCNLPMNRNIVLQRFLESPREQGEWLLFLDTDIRFPAYTAATLLKVAVETEADIVAVPYQLTNGCSTFGTVAKNGGYNTQGRFTFDRAYLIDAAGTGCMMVSRKLLQRMKLAYHDLEPWPFCGYDRIEIGGKPDYSSEDYSLCKRARDIGARIVGYTGIVLSHLKTAPLVFAGLEDMAGK
jgi:hypothetical protein